MLRSLSLLACLLVASSFSFAQTSAKPIVMQSIAAMKQVKTAFGRIQKSERVDGKMVKGDLIFKMQDKPYKVYLYNVTPDEGTEVLYADGWNNNKVYIHPNKFPYINLSFAPFSGILLKDKHHSVFDVGFRYTLAVIEHVLAQHGDDFDKYVSLQKEVVWEGRPCYVVQIDYPEYAFVDYTVLEGEHLLNLDQKLRVPAYKVLDINPGVKDFFDVKPGQVIKVPNVYARKVHFFIDKENLLPIVQIVYDELGLFEKYEYVKLDVNPKFHTDEFAPEWEEYNFKN